MDTEHAQQRSCVDCVSFQQKEEEIGYCQLHRMYVLSTFDCPKYVQRLMVTEKNLADGSGEDRSEKTQTFFSKKGR